MRVTEVLCDRLLSWFIPAWLCNHCLGVNSTRDAISDCIRLIESDLQCQFIEILRHRAAQREVDSYLRHENIVMRWRSASRRIYQLPICIFDTFVLRVTSHRKAEV